MTGTQIIAKFENMVGDSLDQDFALQLANDAMHEVEEDINPEGLNDIDTSNSTTVGQTYTTGIALPTDFYLPTKTIYVGTTPYIQVPFEKAVEYRDLNGFFYIDNANGTYHLCGTQTSVQTITFPYKYATADITTSTSPAWPSQFHSIIPLKMAEMYFPIDGSERGRSWDDKWREQYTKRVNRFRDYDAALKLAAINHSASPVQTGRSSEDSIDIE